MKTKITLAALVFAMLSGCSSNADMVQNAYYGNYKSITVGQAFNNWKSCKSVLWEEFVTENQAKIVSYTCDLNSDAFFSEVRAVFQKTEGSGYALDVVSARIIVEFVINHDNTFKVSGVFRGFTWADGVEKEWSEDSPADVIRSIYGNEIILDSAGVNAVMAAGLNFSLLMAKKLN